MKIKSELLAKIALLVIGSIAIVGLNAYVSYLDMMAERKLKTKHLVESRQGILKFYHDKAIQGTITEDVAKKEAKAAIRNIRYDQNEYFWIQTDDKTPTMLMHATTPELEGKILNDKKFDCVTHIQKNMHSKIMETIGKTNLFIAISELAKENGEGFIFYQWTKPQADGTLSTQSYPKISYFQAYKEWGWIVGSGIYVDDVKESVLKNLMMSLLLALISIFVWFKLR
jgi:methyl-accepting chemotaxis protein